MIADCSSKSPLVDLESVMGKEYAVSHMGHIWGRCHLLESQRWGQPYPKPPGFKEREGGVAFQKGERILGREDPGK